MNGTLFNLEQETPCWNRIGVGGDRSCPELVEYVHCHNCPVFSAAGQQLLNRPPATAYLDEAKERMAVAAEVTVDASYSALAFRIGEEWLALPVETLVEVHPLRPVHRVPHRGGLLAGLVNIRGELELCARFDQLLNIATVEHQSRGAPGINASERSATKNLPATTSWLLVVELEGERWVLPVDEVDQVYRFPQSALTVSPATVKRASGRLSRGVLEWQGRRIGYLDETRLLQALRARIHQ